MVASATMSANRRIHRGGASPVFRRAAITRLSLGGTKSPLPITVTDLLHLLSRLPLHVRPAQVEGYASGLHSNAKSYPARPALYCGSPVRPLLLRSDAISAITGNITKSAGRRSAAASRPTDRTIWSGLDFKMRE